MPTIRRAVIIGNGIAGAENQCLGLVRALGLSHTLYRVTRPRGGINDWLRWLPVSLHKNLHNVVKRFRVTGFSGIAEAKAHYIAKLARETLDKDGPTLVVASGRDTISVASSIKRLAPENVFVVQVSDILVRELGSHPKVYIWNGQDPNPHMGHLAWGDAFVVTADSVSMLSEACSTGKPVYVIGTEQCKWKFADFHKSLRDRGAVRPFTGEEDMSERWKYVPLNDTEEAAAQVITALAQRGWRL